MCQFLYSSVKSLVKYLLCGLLFAKICHMKALYICGSLNQTKMMYKVSQHLPQFTARFTPYYCDGFLKILQKNGLLNFTVLGGNFVKQTLAYLEERNVCFDFAGTGGPYDLVFTCSDLVIPKNILGSRLVLIQEGMTDPENVIYALVKRFRLPRWMASTSTTGLSNVYDLFCVASEGYRDLFICKGADGRKIKVTGIPNFDHCESFLDNSFPHKDYVLVATSDMRETFRFENRRKFIHYANTLADGRQLIFKFHPNENFNRARREVECFAPQALSFTEGNTDHMVANCSALLTRYSSVVFVAAALDKEVHCDIPMERLRRLLPQQNGGLSAANIARECLKLFDESPAQAA